MPTLAKSEDLDEMPHDAAFHQGLHCLLRQKRPSEKEIQLYFEVILTCDPLDIQWTISSVKYEPRKKNSLMHKVLINK